MAEKRKDDRPPADAESMGLLCMCWVLFLVFILNGIFGHRIWLVAGFLELLTALAVTFTMRKRPRKTIEDESPYHHGLAATDMAENPETTEPRHRWYQYNLRTLLVAIALAAIPLALFLESRSLRKMVDERSGALRLDQADMLFNAQLGMAEERLKSGVVSPHTETVIIRSSRDERRGNEVRRVIEWDFAYHAKDDLDTVRREIRSCLDPIQWLGNYGEPSYWNWEVKQEVNFFEQRQQGEIIVTAVYRSYQP